ncbi:MAG: hypothetical protein E6I80_20915 [Chloroflexi bacterium]|nr:MAG: hypothetical protein E6I80_20915 [Chloroflexota bacterium]
MADQIPAQLIPRKILFGNPVKTSAQISPDGKRLAYLGSYGGYAALVGATFTPDLFCCAVDVVGPSNLITLNTLIL